MTENILIEASAGTGKTFSLATRFIRLLAETSATGGSVRPEQIIALTFSRAATREIYAKLAQRLAEAAASDNAAAEESKRIGKTLTKEDFGKILSAVIASQHIGTISTIDSFILRMIRYFPLELGFQGNVEILSTFDGEAEKREASRSFLSSGSVTDDFISAFHETLAGKSSKSFAAELDKSISKWREFILDHPETREWNVDTMFAALGIDPSDIRSVKSADDLAVSSAATPEEKADLVGFLNFFGTYNGGPSPLPGTGLEKKIAEAFVNGEPLDSITFNKKNHSFSPAAAQALKEDLRSAFTLHLAIKLRQMAGILSLVAQIDDKYDEATRSQGRLTFGDLPRVLAKHDGLDVENLQYRFDEQLDHWAIDEFQDTSRAQWKCLSNLVDNAASGDGGRTVTIVGDVKQAIYGWRGGDEEIFSELADRPDFRHQQLAASFRYGQNTANLLNSVFGKDNLKSCGVQCQTAVDKWLDKNSWMEHTVPEGRKQNDYACVLGVTPAPKGEGNAVLGKTVELVHSLWERRAKNGLTDKTLAVLVRANGKGRELADALRNMDIPAVFEGENTDADHPVVAAFLNLLHFAEHPDDTYDREVIFGTPLARLFAPDVTGVKDAALLSSIVSRDISHLGLVRTLRKYTGECMKSGYGLDDYSRQALNRLVQAASIYETRGEAAGGIDGFIEFFRAMTTRDIANPAVVTVMTIHRSKGLGFDWVVVPIVENGSIEKVATEDTITGNGWVLPHLSENVCKVFPNLKAAYEDGCNKTLLANLHTYYVALSRSKEGLWIVAENKKTDTLYFRDILFAGLGITTGADNSAPLYEAPAAGDPSLMVHPPAPETGNQKIAVTFTCNPSSGAARRKTPSHAHLHGGHKDASTFFSLDFGAASSRGTDIHVALSRIEWLPESAEQPAGIAQEVLDLVTDSPFRTALLKPDDVIDLWRESSFELLDGEDWISGTFDRVVFREHDGEKYAEIYDFKTNAIRNGETNEDFAKRMTDDYSGQMTAYRSAIHHLTGIPPEHISATLLLTANATALEIDR